MLHGIRNKPSTMRVHRYCENLRHQWLIFIYHFYLSIEWSCFSVWSLKDFVTTSSFTAAISNHHTCWTICSIKSWMNWYVFTSAVWVQYLLNRRLPDGSSLPASWVMQLWVYKGQAGGRKVSSSFRSLWKHSNQSTWRSASSSLSLPASLLW